MEPQSPIEHQNVPIEHRGLHDFLYGSDDEHTATAPTSPILNDEVLPLTEWSARAANAKVAGVYAVFDRHHQPQYVGYSRNVLLSLNGHVTQLGSELCASVRVQAFKFPNRMEMEALRDAWIGEYGSPPDADCVWATTVGEAAVAAMSAADRAAYEEKKLKLQKAMALSLTAESKGNQGQEPDDDWSVAIGKQTDEAQG